VNSKLNKVSVQNSEISKQDYTHSETSQPKPIDIKARHEFRKQILDSLKIIKSKTSSLITNPGETKVDTNLTTEQQKLNEKIYQRKMSISVRNAKHVKTVDHPPIEKAKLKKSKSTPLIENKLDQEQPKKQAIGAEELKNFKKWMLHKNSYPVDEKVQPHSLTPIEESNEEEKDEKPIILQ
jgi:hypothetical protein